MAHASHWWVDSDSEEDAEDAEGATGHDMEAHCPQDLGVQPRLVTVAGQPGKNEGA